MAGRAAVGKREMPMDDPALVEALRSGDPQAARLLIERYQGVVFGLCYRMLSHRQDAEDVAQEAFVRALRAIHGFDATRPLRPWLLEIAANRCRTALADRARRPALSSQPIDDRPDPRPGLPDSDDLAGELERGLQGLRPEYRLVFALYHEQNLSYEEIAESVARPVGTVKTWLHRAAPACRGAEQPWRPLLNRETRGIANRSPGMVSRVGEANAMTCIDFQQKWNELLDAEAGQAVAPQEGHDLPSVAAGEALLLAHADECATCRPIAARYQVLRHAIHAWRRPPAPPLDLADRVLSTPSAMPPAMISAESRFGGPWRIRRPSLGIVSGLAAAAILCMVVGVAFDRLSRPDRPDRPTAIPENLVHDAPSVSVPVKATPDSLALNRALAEATSATWDLARSTSEPAARIGRDVLDATSGSEPGVIEKASRATSASPRDSSEGMASLSIAVPSLDPLAPDTSAVLQQVGGQLSAGVRPLSSTARHAFGFLLGSSPDRAETRTRG